MDTSHSCIAKFGYGTCSKGPVSHSKKLDCTRVFDTCCSDFTRVFVGRTHVPILTGVMVHKIAHIGVSFLHMLCCTKLIAHVSHFGTCHTMNAFINTCHTAKTCFHTWHRIFLYLCSPGNVSNRTKFIAHVIMGTRVILFVLLL